MEQVTRARKCVKIKKKEVLMLYKNVTLLKQMQFVDHNKSKVTRGTLGPGGNRVTNN